MPDVLNYLCKECGDPATAVYNEIVKRGKLCLPCVTKNKQAVRVLTCAKNKLCKEAPVPSKARKKKKSNNPNSKYLKTFKCFKCGHSEDCLDKPNVCKTCSNTMLLRIS